MCCFAYLASRLRERPRGSARVEGHGRPRVTHRAPQPQPAPRLPRAKTNKQNPPNNQHTRKEGGRGSGSGSCLASPRPPGRDRKPAGRGASTEPPAGAASPGKSRSGNAGERGSPRSSPCRPWVRPGSGESPRLSPFRGKSNGEQRKMPFSGLRLCGCQRCVLPAERATPPQQVFPGSTLYGATGERDTCAIQPGLKHNKRLGPWVAVLVVRHGAPACRSAPVAGASPRPGRSATRESP